MTSFLVFEQYFEDLESRSIAELQGCFFFNLGLAVIKIWQVATPSDLVFWTLNL